MSNDKINTLESNLKGTIEKARKYGLNVWVGLSHLTDELEIRINKNDGAFIRPNYDHPPLLILNVDEDDFTIRIADALEGSLKNYKNKVVSIGWLDEFIVSNGIFKEEVDVDPRATANQPIHRPRALNSQKIYYVYSHTFLGGEIYIGKGSRDRAQEFNSGRSSKYNQLLNEHGSPAVEIIAKEMNEEIAYILESTLIIRARAEGLNIINKTDGLEAAYIEDLPWRTLKVLAPKITEGKYLKVVHIRREKGILTSTSLGVTIVDAAIRVECTIGEFLRFLDSPKDSKLNDWRILSNEQACLLYPEYTEKILSGKPM